MFYTIGYCCYSNVVNKEFSLQNQAVHFIILYGVSTMCQAGNIEEKTYLLSLPTLSNINYKYFF
jgi:hypothetical protein